MHEIHGKCEGKIQAQDTVLNQLTHEAAFYRSLLIFSLTLIFATGEISKEQVEDLESLLMKKQLLPNSVKSKLVQNACSNFATPLAKCATN